jgi:hypothetical protein
MISMDVPRRDEGTGHGHCGCGAPSGYDKPILSREPNHVPSIDVGLQPTSGLDRLWSPQLSSRTIWLGMCG